MKKNNNISIKQLCAAVHSAVSCHECASSVFNATDRRLCWRHCASVQPWRRL